MSLCTSSVSSIRLGALSPASCDWNSGSFVASESNAPMDALAHGSDCSPNDSSAVRSTDAGDLPERSLARMSCDLALGLSLHVAHVVIAPHCCVRSSRANRSMVFTTAMGVRPDFTDSSALTRLAVASVDANACNSAKPPGANAMGPTSTACATAPTPPRITISTPTAGDAANISASASAASACRRPSLSSSSASTAVSIDQDPPPPPVFGVNLAPDSASAYTSPPTSSDAACVNLGLLTTLAGSSGLLSTGSTDLLAVFGAGSKRLSSVDGATKRSSLSTAAADGVRMEASSARLSRSRSSRVDIMRRPAPSGVLNPPPGTFRPDPRPALGDFPSASAASRSSAALRSLGDSLLFVADLAPPRSPRIQSRSSANSPLNVIVLNSTSDLRSNARIPSATRRS
mmetsp:Transcript_673/g.3114  ORF Transcript_673/g.3114 Transcript_673/m.3114 type:complete len:402 (+) Transcript_673:360-1565(+)